MRQIYTVTILTGVFGIAAAVSGALVTTCQSSPPPPPTTTTVPSNNGPRGTPDDDVSREDLAGLWSFRSEIVRRKDSEGMLVRKRESVTGTIEMEDEGEALRGTMTSTDSDCPKGDLAGSVKADQVRWIVRCEGQCAGEELEFKGTVTGDGDEQRIRGRMEPRGTPRSSSCNLAYYSNLFGFKE